MLPEYDKFIILAYCGYKDLSNVNSYDRVCVGFYILT